MASIYALCDERGDIRYIGKANDPASRLKGHLRESRRRTPLYDWMRSLTAVPVMLILEERCSDWEQAERDWIAAGRIEGARLLNLAHGGDQPFCSVEQRKLNALALNGRFKADPQLEFIRNAKRHMGYALKRGWLTERTKEKLRRCAAINPKLFGAWRHI